MSDGQDEGLSRRAFLTMSWRRHDAPAASTPPPARNLIPLGAIEDLHALGAGQVAVSPTRADIYMVRTSTGILTLRARCPNDGAAVAWRADDQSEDTLSSSGRFYCSRDASIFNRLGELSAGPADGPLPALPVIESDGMLWADEAKPEESDPEARRRREFNFPDPQS